MGQEADLGTVAGIFTCFNAMFNCIVIYYHGGAFADPSAAYATAEEMGRVAVEQNPELARQAMQAAVNNPQVVRSAGAAYGEGQSYTV